MSQLALPEMPLSKDEQHLVYRLGCWYPSGIGGMGYSCIKYQLGWNDSRTGQVVTSLVDKGIIWRESWDGSYYLESRYPQDEGKMMREMMIGFLKNDFMGAACSSITMEVLK
jgi:hypothetical protein